MSNPLQKYFRVPGLHVALPTKGAFMPPDSLAQTSDGTYSVLPMRASDELLLKSPDALMNGFAIEKMIESCIPDIKNAKTISSPDLDVILLAIRAATYGDKMEVQAACPECKHDNTFDCHLPSLLNRVKEIDAETMGSVRLSDEVVAYVRPYCFSDATKMQNITFEETRKVQALEGNEEVTDDERREQMNASLKTMTDLTAQITRDCVVKVVVPEGEVTDRANIDDFLSNISRGWMKLIETRLKDLNSAGLDKSIDMKCEKCEHEWKTNLEFDPSNFFDSGS